MCTHLGPLRDGRLPQRRGTGRYPRPVANPRMTAEIGRVLGGRYRLVTPIGMGASAQVYLADDVRLRRRVALKMLHDALAGDAEFLRRFRAEARAAAALSHPNVMAVYDWGDDDTAFIVTEYLGGGSLRGLLDRGELLSQSQALAVGLEATRALDYAHRRGFVHRDIKPANLLFGEEQRLRIADFGLARALAEAAWTEPQGAMLGTARYASPEQAKGEKVNGKADVYALALVLVEAVTGEVPFAADTTIGTLMARVDKQLVVPDELGPLQGVLMRAGHPDPEQRIDARTLAAGLLRAAKALSKPAALPLAGALPPAGELVGDGDPTVHAPLSEPAVAPDLTDEDLDLDPPHWVNQTTPADAVVDPVDRDVEPGPDAEAEAEGESRGSDPVGSVDPEPEREVLAITDRLAPGDASPADHLGPAWSDEPQPGPEPVDRVVDPTATVAAPAPDRTRVGVGAAATGGAPSLAADPDRPDHADDENHDEDEDDGGRRRRRWPWVLLVIILLAGGGGAAAVANIDREPPIPQRTVVLPVPTLGGRDQETAEAVAGASGWKTTVRSERRDGTSKGQVLDTVPAPGARLKGGGSIELLVSAGQTEVDVPPDLAGRPLADATAALEAAGLKAATSETRFDEDVDKGSVVGAVGTTPPRLEKGTTVNLVVSDGPRPRTVPSGVVGNTEAGASQAITDQQLEVAVNRQFNDTVPVGQVVSQSPRPGTEVPRGSTVTMEVSRGPETAAVPDVTGAGTPAQAAAILRAAGLVPGSVSGASEGSPTGTSPSRGTTVKKGSKVNIVLG